MDDLGAARAKLAAGTETLAAYQLDLLAQIEAQPRAVRLTIRRIEGLRTSKMTRSLTDAQRGVLLSGLWNEIEAIDAQLTLEHTSCRLMQDTIQEMQKTIADLL